MMSYFPVKKHEVLGVTYYEWGGRIYCAQCKCQQDIEEVRDVYGDVKGFIIIAPFHHEGCTYYKVL